jgi:hypothetical protein
MRELERLDYDVYLVEEVCGGRADCRNLLGFPRSRAALFAGSPTLNLAAGTLALQRAAEANIWQLAYPCCARGAGCKGCRTIHTERWMETHLNPGPFTRISWKQQGQYMWPLQRIQTRQYGPDEPQSRLPRGDAVPGSLSVIP